MKAFDSALYGVCEPLRHILNQIPPQDKAQIFEIRLREGRPVMLTTADGSCFLGQDAKLRRFYTTDCVCAAAAGIRASFDLLCAYSVQSLATELRSGYIAMQNGHRAGVGGEGVMQGDKLLRFRKVSSLNIRIARQITGVAAPVLHRLH